MTLEEIALLETDPKSYKKFKPLSLGFFAHIVVLTFIVLIYAPYIVSTLLCKRFFRSAL